MYKWLSKSIISEINLFLSDRTGTFNPLFTPISNDEKLTNNEENFRRIVFSILTKLPLQKTDIKNIEDFRDETAFVNNYFYVYNDHAINFLDFRISNYSKSLNDKFETKWFKEYIASSLSNYSNSANYKSIKDGIDKAITLRDVGKIRAKYTTMSSTNEQYMISNYSRFKRCRSAYDSVKVINNFDMTYKANNVFPIRGFVRYDNPGRNLALIELFRLSTNFYLVIPNAFEFISLLLSYFIKGNCMSIEEEYRFIIISSRKSMKDIKLSISPNFHIIKKCLCMENPYYLGFTDCTEEPVQCYKTKCE